MIKMNLQYFGGRSSSGTNAKKSAERRAEAKATNDIKNFRETDKQIKLVLPDNQKDTISRTLNRIVDQGERKYTPKNKLPKGATSQFIQTSVFKGTNRIGSTYDVTERYTMYQGNRLVSEVLSVKKRKK